MSRLLERVSTPGVEHRIRGLVHSSVAWAICRLATQSTQPCLILCRNEKAASLLTEDLEALDRTCFERKLSPTHFPHWDTSLRHLVAPSLRVRQARAGVLARLASDKKPRIIVATVPAATFSTLPPEAHRARSLVPEKTPRDQMIAGLVAAGYLRADSCDDPGSFSVRGDLIDVFPVDREKPLRIEYFGDDLERVREYDPKTQRSDRDEDPSLRDAPLFPAREVLLNVNSWERVKRLARERADELGMDRRARDPILGALAQDVYPEHSEGWAYWAYEKHASLLDYAQFDTYCVDSLAVQTEWEEFTAEESRLERLGEKEGKGYLLLPGSAQLYRAQALWDEAGQLKARVKLETLALEGAGPEALDAGTLVPSLPPGGGAEARLKAASELIAQQSNQRFRCLVFARGQTQMERLKYLLEQHHIRVPGQAVLYPEPISAGFLWPEEGLLVLSEDDILPANKNERSRGKEQGDSAKSWAGLQALSDLSPQDLVVHKLHGIGRYIGMTRLGVQGAESDFIHLEYADKDRLYIPVYRLNVVQKYAGGQSAPLDKLGAAHFQKAKEKVKEAVRKLAVDLVDLYAKRKLARGIVMGSRDPAFREFEATFPYEETPDQLKAIDETLSDLSSGRMMDRLVCGDVGYGKTEVAIRAAYRAVLDGYQVAVLVPTTVLANQHEISFRARMSGYPVTIESVSRFKPAKQQKEILERVKQGKVDIIIGTHRLFSQDVSFNNLGLVIVDEEHRFGVEHKEKLKALKLNAHVLTLTATPIPRTLNMALSGLRDITIMNTPPSNRLPIKTFVSRYDEDLIKRAVETELSRGGQVFFLHNRVSSIDRAAQDISKLVPGAKISIAHGQMSEKELEKAMMDFYEKASQILVCTTIIESGLDIPSANTMVIDRADALGLAQLYQIRGRVGRGQERAYAYLLIPEAGGVSEDAKKRLDVIQRFVELGSGFSVASHDLEIRGGGNLLGPQQSGHIATVGFDLYVELLDEAVRELQGKAPAEEDADEPEIKTPFSAFLDEKYVPDVHQRLALYRRLSSASNEEQLVELEAELKDRFGPLPVEATNLLWVIRLKQLLKSLGLVALTVGKDRFSILPGKTSRLDPAKAIAWVASGRGKYQLLPDSKFVAILDPWAQASDLFFKVQEKLLALKA